jgi:hypothetical protein
MKQTILAIIGAGVLGLGIDLELATLTVLGVALSTTGIVWYMIIKLG